MITTLLRLLFLKKIRSFKFKTKRDFLPDMNISGIGLYIHIPYCETICPFCPYYKKKYDKDEMELYINALIKEIELVATRLSEKKHIHSLYFGGGSPALAGPRLIEIIDTVKKYFIIDGDIGIELNPTDINRSTLDIVKHAGFNMVSIGVQSFKKELITELGRKEFDFEKRVNLLKSYNFDVIDVDLIFGIPGQKPNDISSDFTLAVKGGATQVSTYPYINFSYTNIKNRPYGMFKKRELLEALQNISEYEDFERSSVWTFKRVGSRRYSSVTRDNFIGFGASATSLGKDSFKINLLSVEEYIKEVESGNLPSNLTMEFTPKSRGLYWMFWAIYNGKISKIEYEKLFSRSLKLDFGRVLNLGVFCKLLKEKDEYYVLTNRGLYWFHIVEQIYTHQYIDKTWRYSMKNPWVKEIKLY